MSNRKPLTRQSLKQAYNDMMPELNKLRNEKPALYSDESWVVGMTELDTKEIRRLNYQLGLDSNEGINQWYFRQ
jgi:hypothetical protein